MAKSSKTSVDPAGSETGDLLYVTGALGGSGMGLELLSRSLNPGAKVCRDPPASAAATAVQRWRSSRERRLHRR